MLFFAAALLCSTMTAAQSASASAMPDCSRHSAGADTFSSCAFELAYSVPPKQADVQLDFLAWTTLAKVDFAPLVLSVIPHWKNTSRLRPKEKIYLLKSVLTI
jgi:hypothetical protein